MWREKNYKNFVVSTFCKTSADNVQNLNYKLHQKSETFEVLQTFEACKRHLLFSTSAEEEILPRSAQIY